MTGSETRAGPVRPDLAKRLILPRYNLRDYGGVTTRDGARLVSDMLFRSAELDRCHPNESDLLERLGVQALVDFRSPGEIPATVPAAHPRFTGQRFATANDDTVIPHALNRFASLNTPAEARATLTETYRKFALSDHFRVTLKLYFEMLAHTNGPSLIHCFAGKDRTGIAVALFQSHMNVHPDDIADQFMITHAAGEDRVAYLRETMVGNAQASIQPDVLEELLTVRAEYLEAALAEIVTHYGDIPTYLRDGAGIEPETLGALPQRYFA